MLERSISGSKIERTDNSQVGPLQAAMGCRASGGHTPHRLQTPPECTDLHFGRTPLRGGVATVFTKLLLIPSGCAHFCKRQDWARLVDWPLLLGDTWDEPHHQGCQPTAPGNRAHRSQTTLVRSSRVDERTSCQKSTGLDTSNGRFRFADPNSFSKLAILQLPTSQNSGDK